MAGTAKKTTGAARKREPSPAALLKKVASVSDSTKALQKEIKAMSKIFADNQKILVSMKNMMDALTSTLEHVQKHSKQISIMEEDTQKLYAGLNRVKSKSDVIGRLNDQTARLQEEVSRVQKIQEASNTGEIARQVEDSMHSIQNNAKMIIRIAQRIDEVRDELRDVSGRTDSLLEIGSDIDRLKKSIDGISEKTARLDAGTHVIEDIKDELGRIAEKVSSDSNLGSELNAIRSTIDAISAKASRIDSLGGVIENLQNQFKAVAADATDTNSMCVRSVSDLAGKIDRIETDIGTLSRRADSTAFVGEGLKSVQSDLNSLREGMLERTDGIEQKIASASEMIKRQDAGNAEFHKKTESMFKDIQAIKSAASKASGDSSREMMALLRLSEYQSGIRMNAESKYGDSVDLEKMAQQTVQIINLFDRISIEAGEEIPLPREVRQWAISKILDCADRWEIRFEEVYSMLKNTMGKMTLNESLRIQQVRDIYGIRAVDKIRRELDIS